MRQSKFRFLDITVREKLDDPAMRVILALLNMIFAEMPGVEL